jgi:hypothetical protein
VKRGEAAGEAHVWRDGFDDWMDVNDVPELRPYLPRHPPPPPRGKSGLYPIASMIAGTPHQGLPVVQQPMPQPAPSPLPIGGYGTPVGPTAAPMPQPPTPTIPPGQGGQGSGLAPVPVPPIAPQSPGSGLFPQVRVAEPSGPLFPQPPAQIQPGGLPREDRTAPTPLPAPAPVAAEPDLTPLPLAPRPSQEGIAVPVQVPPVGRTPLWMVIAGIGGGLAAICGLFLVGYFLFFEHAGKEGEKKVAVNPSPAQPTPPPEVIPDVGAEPISFPPMEIARSEQAERKVPSGRPRHKAARAPTEKPLSASQRRLMALYGDKDNPNREAPEASAPRRAKSGPRRRINANELMSLQRKHRASLKACYERALKRDQSLTEVKAEVEVSIGDSGIVRAVHIAAGNNPDLISCIQRSIKRWAFPSVGAQTFSFPIIFRGS